EAKDEKKDGAKDTKDEKKDGAKDDKKDTKDEKKDGAKDDKKDEKKDTDAEPKLKSDKPKVRLIFGKKEGELVYVRREEADEKYGLKAPTLRATVTVKTKDDKPEDHVYTFGKETEDKNGRYAKQGERDVVFLVRPTTISALQSELLDSTVLQFDPAKVKSIKL